MATYAIGLVLGFSMYRWVLDHGLLDAAVSAAITGLGPAFAVYAAQNWGGGETGGGAPT